MSAYPPSKIFADAADELVAEFAARQFQDSINERDAMPYVDAQVAMAWIALQSCDQSPQTTLCDLIEKLTDGEATVLLGALLMQNGIPPLADLSRVMHTQVAHDLAAKAEIVFEGGIDPAPTYDPTAADRCELARQWNAMLRAGVL